MRIFVLRNSSFEENAGLKRVFHALKDNHDLHFITRQRKVIGSQSIETKNISQNHKNTIINLRGSFGKGGKNLLTLSKYISKLTLILIKKRGEYDYIHSFDLDTGIPALLLSKVFKKKYKYHIADYYVASRPGINKTLKVLIEKLEHIVIKNSESTIICTEERTKQIHGSKPKELVVIHNSPVLLSCPIVEKGKNDLNLCYIGTLNNNRFLMEMIDVIKNMPNVFFVIGGYGSEEQLLKEKVKEVKNINFIGRVAYEDTFQYYAKSDLMVAIYSPQIANHQYSAPNKAYEAMAMSKPIIVAKNTGIDKIVEREKMGYVIDYDKIVFEKVLKEIIENKNDLKIKSTNSGNAYIRYGWFEMRNRLKNLYEKL